MRLALPLLFASSIALADASVPRAARPSAASPEASEPKDIVCGTRLWQSAVAAVERYCENDAEPSEARGCRAILHSMRRCHYWDRLYRKDGERDLWTASVGDPQDQSYDWQLDFTPTPRGFDLAAIRYGFVDCDAP